MKKQVAKKTKAPVMEHSTFGASSMKRIMECPGSVRLSAGLKGVESEHALEGTKAHACLEWVLKQTVLSNQPRTPSTFHNALKNAALKYGWNDEMCIYAIDAAKWVNEQRSKIRGKVFSEIKLDAGAFTRPGEFGTNDIGIVSLKNRHLITADFKYGAGVLVDVKDNVQLQYYALAMLLKFGFYNFDKVTTVIIQPRIDHPDGCIRSHTEPVENFIEYGKKIKRAVKAALRPNAPVKSGEHCQFCPAKFKCPEYNKAPFKDLTSNGVQLPVELSGGALNFSGDIGKMLDASEKLSALVKSIREHAFRLALGGQKVNGYKLVNGKSTRYYVDPYKAQKEAKAKWGSDVLTTPQLLSPAQFEKKFKGNKDAQAWLKKNVSQKSGSLTLVKDSDRRKAVTPIEDAFDDGEYDYLT